MNEIPMTKKEIIARGWENLDFIIISGDAFIDHPSFGVAIIARVLLAHNYKVAIIAQPDWKNINSIKIFGEPKIGFLVTAGNIDSMVNHYYVSKKRRKNDKYSVNGVMDKRPDRATIVYSKLCKTAYNKPVIIGGIEASLRRLAHYDYWDDNIRKSILIDSDADLLIYGMAENTIVEVADALKYGLNIKDVTYIRGTVWKTNEIESLNDEYILLPSYSELKNDKKNYAISFNIQEKNTDPHLSKILIEKQNEHIYVIQNKPALPLNKDEMDWVYSLDYSRLAHSSYKGEIPALFEVSTSINVNRGCFGGCSFCALTYHQGKIVQARSKKSVIDEAKIIINEPNFKGFISDVGGPTANFYNPSCKKQFDKGTCLNKDCLGYEPCNNLEVSHTEYTDILKDLRNLDGVKKVFVRSGIRYDYAMLDKNKNFLNEVIKYHVSGQLRVAPEHFSDNVLKLMRKPNYKVFKDFYDYFYKYTKQIKKEQYLVPYLISSHPGSRLTDAIDLAVKLKQLKIYPEQVQDFYPTPGTAATAMYYSGFIPWSMEKVYIPRDREEKQMQRALLQFNKPNNYSLVKKALIKANRSDLIGFKETCLIKP